MTPATSERALLYAQFAGAVIGIIKARSYSMVDDKETCNMISERIKQLDTQLALLDKELYEEVAAC